VVDLRFAIRSESAEGPGPSGVGSLSRRQCKYRSRSGIDIEHVTVTVDNDDAIVNALQNGQNSIVCFRETSQQSVTLNGMLDNYLELGFVNIVHANIALCPGAYGRHAAMFLLTAAYRDQRPVGERVNQRSQGLAGLRDQWSGLKHDQVNCLGSVFRNIERPGCGDLVTQGQSLQFVAKYSGKLTPTEVQN
jgi:hypothetical protein